jgi:hypothetical protein
MEGEGIAHHNAGLPSIPLLHGEPQTAQDPYLVTYPTLSDAILMHQHSLITYPPSQGLHD